MNVDLHHEEERPHVAHLRIDFGSLNLVTTERLRDLDAAVRSVPEDVSVLSIAPEGEGLSAGLDLEWARERTPHEGWELLSTLYRAIQAVRDVDAVTVCGLGEYAIGAGFELAMACDFRIASPEASLGLPEVDVGLPTVIQGGLLLRLVGLQRAKELIYLGETVSGERARELGLVNEAASGEAYEGAIEGTVDALAEKSPLVLAWQKRVFRAWRSPGLESGMERSVGMGAQCFGTHDQREAMSAFLEDRQPSFERR